MQSLMLQSMTSIIMRLTVWLTLMESRGHSTTLNLFSSSSTNLKRHQHQLPSAWRLGWRITLPDRILWILATCIPDIYITLKMIFRHRVSIYGIRICLGICIVYIRSISNRPKVQIRVRATIASSKSNNSRPTFCVFAWIRLFNLGIINTV